jgi:hypothetical protein
MNSPATAREEVTRLLESTGPLGPADVARETGRSVDSVKQLLRRMHLAGELRNVEGRYSVPTEAPARGLARLAELEPLDGLAEGPAAVTGPESLLLEGSGRRLVGLSSGHVFVFDRAEKLDGGGWVALLGAAMIRPDRHLGVDGGAPVMVRAQSIAWVSEAAPSVSGIR